MDWTEFLHAGAIAVLIAAVVIQSAMLGRLRERVRRLESQAGEWQRAIWPLGQ